MPRRHNMPRADERSTAATLIYLPWDGVRSCFRAAYNAVQGGFYPTWQLQNYNLSSVVDITFEIFMMTFSSILQESSIMMVTFDKRTTPF